MTALTSEPREAARELALEWVGKGEAFTRAREVECEWLDFHASIAVHLIQMLDDQRPGIGAQIREELASLTPKPGKDSFPGAER